MFSVTTSHHRNISTVYVIERLDSTFEPASSL